MSFHVAGIWALFLFGLRHLVQEAHIVVKLGTIFRLVDFVKAPDFCEMRPSLAVFAGGVILRGPNSRTLFAPTPIGVQNAFEIFGIDFVTVEEWVAFLAEDGVRAIPAFPADEDVVERVRLETGAMIEKVRAQGALGLASLLNRSVNSRNPRDDVQTKAGDPVMHSWRPVGSAIRRSHVPDFETWKLLYWFAVPGGGRPYHDQRKLLYCG